MFTELHGPLPLLQRICVRPLLAARMRAVASQGLSPETPFLICPAGSGELPCVSSAFGGRMEAERRQTGSCGRAGADAARGHDISRR